MSKPNRKSEFNVKLAVNGEKVQLNDFVNGFICETVIGMLKSLKGVDDTEDIILKISKNQDSSKA